MEESIRESGISKQAEVGKKLRFVRQDNMKVLPCFATAVIFDTFCEFLLSGYTQKKLSNFNPTSEVSHMQQNILVYIIPSVTF